MSTLALVRHGQASFFSDNYDQLSPLGEEQARLLGQHWLQRGVRIDEVYTGPRVRQIETAALTGEAFAKEGLAWPEPQVLPELDEHQVDRLIKVAMPRVIQEYPDVGQLHAAYQQAADRREKHRTFQRMFERLVMLWVDGRVGAEGVESWPAFRERVTAGLRKIAEAPGRGRNVAVFTSVGAITVAMKVALGLEDRTAFDVGWRVRNASVTDFIFSEKRITLEGFNFCGHLEKPEQWTFR